MTELGTVRRCSLLRSKAVVTTGSHRPAVVGFRGRFWSARRCCSASSPSGAGTCTTSPSSDSSRSAGEASQVLRVSVGNIQAPLGAAATIACVTDGDPTYFQAAMADQVGPAATQMHSAALYRIGSDEPIATVGDPLDLPADGPSSAGSIVASATSNPFVVVDRLADGRRLGYAVVDNADDPQYVVYAEREAQLEPQRPPPDLGAVRPTRLCDLPEHGDAPLTCWARASRTASCRSVGGASRRPLRSATRNCCS